jgi:hypothetical protein
VPAAGLIEDLAARRLGLFAGSGLSAQLGLPPWRGLIERMSGELGYDPDIFLSLGEYPELAEYYEQRMGGLGPLVDWMRANWCDAPLDLAGSAAHELIARLRFPVIYTTNYDPWLERAHALHGAGHVRVVSAADIAAPHDGVTQIVKLHGDLEHDRPLVVTQSHYFERLRFEDPLDIKLRSDMLRYSLLFVGYSLSDINIRLMLHRLALIRAGQPEASPLRSYVLLNRQNPVQLEVLRQWNVEVLYMKDIDPGSGLVSFLEGLAAGDVAPLLIDP